MRILRRMSNQLKTERIQLLMAEAEVKAIDDWSFANRIRSRGAAIRRLVELGLKAAQQPKKRGGD